MHYSRHGDVKARKDKDLPLVYIELTGPFNDEFMNHYNLQIAPLREQMKYQHWVSLVSFTNEGLLPLSMRDGVLQSMEAAKTMGLIASAVVFDQQTPSTVAQQFWEQIYEKASLPHRFFKNIADAKSWLLTELEN